MMKSIIFFFKERIHTMLLFHVCVIFFICSIGVLTFFYLYLPITTHFNEKILVPPLQGLNIEETEEILKEKELQYVIRDSVYQNETPRFTVVSQDPSGHSLVKKGRKIYLTLNAAPPPKTFIPPIIYTSVKNTLSQLSISKIYIKDIHYKEDIAKNAILGVIYQSKLLAEDSIKNGYLIPKGDSIELIVGTGLPPNHMVKVIDVVGLSVHSVIDRLINNGLKAIIYFKNTDNNAKGIILNQSIEAYKMVPMGTIIELWVSKSSDFSNE